MKIKIPKRITSKWLLRAAKELNLNYFEATAARILLQTNGRDSMLRYLEAIREGK